MKISDFLKDVDPNKCWGFTYYGLDGVPHCPMGWACQQMDPSIKKVDAALDLIKKLDISDDVRRMFESTFSFSWKETKDPKKAQKQKRN